MTDQLRSDATAIWQAGVDAVRSDQLVKSSVQRDGDWLVFSASAHNTDACRVHLPSLGRIAVIGAGKAGAGMAAGLEEALGDRIIAEKHLTGWINVPADCVQKRLATYLHPARPAGLNEPTEAGVVGTEKILSVVSALGPTDLCICLLSGGGSALLPAPLEGVSLAEKQALTRQLSAAGANIAELNTVRKQLSRIKGGGLARACRAGRLVTLIISDVLGDPLDVIASGPTVPDTTTPADALAILERFHCATPSLRTALDHLPRTRPPSLCHTTNLLIGNNAVAVAAAGREAQRRGYASTLIPAETLEGPAEEVGRQHAQILLQMLAGNASSCLITGGEPTVKLAPPEKRGKGGRNQQLVLAALHELITDSQNPESKIQNPKSPSASSPAVPTAKTARPTPPGPSSTKTPGNVSSSSSSSPRTSSPATMPTRSSPNWAACSRLARPIRMSVMSASFSRLPAPPLATYKHLYKILRPWAQAVRAVNDAAEHASTRIDAWGVHKTHNTTRQLSR